MVFWDKQPLAKSVSKREGTKCLCLVDRSCAPHFVDLDSERLNEEVLEDWHDILKNFKNLMEDINSVLDREYETEDRQELVHKGNIHCALVVFLTLLMIIVGVPGIFDLEVEVRVYAIVGIGSLTCVIMIVFFCCMGGAGTDEDKRLKEEVTPVVDYWNSLNAQYGVIAECRQEQQEYRGQYLMTIPATLNLWKRGEYECEPLV